MSPKMLNTTWHRPIRYIHFFSGREEQQLCNVWVFIRILNKENYDSNFTSWLCFDKGDATKSVATNSCPKPGIDQCLPSQSHLHIARPFSAYFPTKPHNWQMKPAWNLCQTQQDSLQWDDALCSCSSKWLSISRITSQQKMDLSHPSGRQMWYFWACSMMQL